MAGCDVGRESTEGGSHVTVRLQLLLLLLLAEPVKNFTDLVQE